MFGLVMIVVVLFIIVGDWLVSTREYRSDERDQRTREMDQKFQNQHQNKLKSCEP